MEDSSEQDTRSASVPSRLSALYQYHNAPEVAPAHGLEYDDTIYPSSDKYPVIREHIYNRSRAKYGYSDGGDNRPPRIIFGMKVRTFLVVALVMTLIIVGAAVGGAVGGQTLRDQDADGLSSGLTTTTTSNATATSTVASATSAAATSYSAATPTFTPLAVACPATNNTIYTSSFATSSSSSSGAGLNFTRYCDVTNPLSLSGATHIAEAYAYSFADCIEVCAGYNYWNDGSNCTAAVYEATAAFPGNCWIGNAGAHTDVATLGSTSGTDLALLMVS